MRCLRAGGTDGSGSRCSRFVPMCGLDISFFIIFGIKRLDKLRLICQLALHFSFEQCETPFSKSTMSLLKVSVLYSAKVQLVNNTKCAVE